jgi:hypothetical protein
MTLPRIEAMATGHGLAVFGCLHPARTSVQLLDSGTLILLGTTGAFWPIFSASPEGTDGTSDPIDRWSTRVISDMAQDLQAKALFPFGGPPYAPFINWALASGRAFSSPTGLLVHDQVGMLLSYRGALHFDHEFDIPAPPLTTSPCSTCTDQPCTHACPVGAMNATGQYSLHDCHSHLDSPKGSDCMQLGCIARRACPLSCGANRNPEQSFHHMRYFHAK